jgi:hypothetical protein
MDTRMRRGWAITAVCAAVGASTATVLLVLAGEKVIAHAIAAPTAVALAATAVLVLICASAACLTVGFLWTVATLLALTAVAALAPIWVGWQPGPPVVRAIAFVIAGLLPSLAFTIGLIEPGGALRRRWAARAVGASLVLGICSVAFRDPFMDIDCWNDCTAGTAFAPWPTGGVLATTGLVLLSIAMAVSSVGVQTYRFRHADAAVRSWILALGTPAAFVSIILAVHAVLSLAVGGEGAGDSR